MVPDDVSEMPRNSRGSCRVRTAGSAAPLSLLGLLVHCLFALQDTNQDERSFIYGPPKNRFAQLPITCTRGVCARYLP